jgi:hypothetical protein
VGFESAHAARRRLAVLAMSNEHVHEALGTASSSPHELQRSVPKPSLKFESNTPAAVVNHLDQLAKDIVATPGAGGALLVAFAAQARALSLVAEAALRTQGAAALPAEVMAAVQNALRAPAPMAGLELV